MVRRVDDQAEYEEWERLMRKYSKSKNIRERKVAAEYYNEKARARAQGGSEKESYLYARQYVQDNVRSRWRTGKFAKYGVPGAKEKPLETKVELPPGMEPIEIKAVGKGEYKIEETTQGQQSQKEPQEAVTPGELGLGTGFAYSYAFGNKSLPEKNENGKEFTIPQAFAYIRKWLRYQIPIWIKGYRDEFEAVDTNIAEYPKLMRARINEVKYDFGAALDNEAVEIANRHKRPQSFYLALVNHPYFRRLYENAVAKIIKGVAGPVRRPQRLAGPIEVIQETLGTIIGFVFPYLRYILAIIFILIGQSIYANFSVTVTGSLLPLAVIYIIIFFLSDTLSFGTANYSYLIMGNPEETSMLIPGLGIPGKL